MDTYGHLFPDAEDIGRGAIDAVLTSSRRTGGELRNDLPAKPQVSGTEGGESACRPGSVHPLARADGHPSGTAVTGSLGAVYPRASGGQPSNARAGAAPCSACPLDLAPGGVYLASAVTCGAGGLLHRRFTLTSPPARSGEAVCFLWHYPAGHPGSALPTTLPYGARTFLTEPKLGATARPTHPSHRILPRRPMEHR